MAIHIKEKNKGKFTRKAKAHGKGVQEFARQVLANKDNYSTATVKQANFARNFGGRKQTGGYSDEEILGYSDDSPYQDNPYIHINSNNISMAQTGIPLSLIPLDEDFNVLGQYDVDPYSGEYTFDGANSVLEIPKGQLGRGNTPKKISYFERLLNNPEVDELLKLRANNNRGFLNDKRLEQLENKYGSTLKSAEKQFNRINKTKEIPPQEVPKVKINIAAQKLAEDKIRLDPLIKRQQEFQESLNFVAPSKIVQDNTTEQMIREKNSNIKQERVEKKLNKLAEDSSLEKRIKARGTYNYEADLAKEADNAYELAYKSNKLKNLYGQAKPLVKAFLNNPVVKGIGKGLQVIDVINTGIHTKNLYDASKIYDVLQQDNSELGKKYKNLISTSGKFKHGTESLGNFWETGTGQYELETLDQYMVEKNKKESNSAQSFTNKSISSKTPDLNTNIALVNDMDFVRSKEANIPFIQNPSVMGNNTSKGTVTNNSGKSPVTSKIKSKAVVSSNVKKPVTFWNEPTKAELEQQAIDYAPTIDKVDTIIPNDVFSNSTSVIEEPLTGMKKIIPGKPITLEYDNPLEAQAINYRKLKNSEVMPPYRGSMQLQTPSLYQESVDPYLANIKEQRNAVMQNINPNTSTGQAMLAGINANLVDASNKAIGEVNRNNMQNTTNWLNQVADIRNKQQSFDYENNRRYTDEIAQLKAIQDEGDIAYMDSVANMNAKRLQAKNRFLTTAIETGLPSEALNIGDESVTFDVNKIPYQIYTRNSGSNTPVNQKPIKMGDKYYDKVMENGRVRYVPVNIENKQLGGKMSKHKMYK